MFHCWHICYVGVILVAIWRDYYKNYNTVSRDLMNPVAKDISCAAIFVISAARVSFTEQLV